ncbi:Uncharacterized protein DBV15_05805 [Temnothorax longispinosus]|uniref:Uncharacterized protein n=1 Tax=Temnothorax longispinosus TaxID=300112 RepID=A0A4S2LA79_9HYME|nr:Uncharacterized protein DBV15_05805 [Temnothorax longispinosus]
MASSEDYDVDFELDFCLHPMGKFAVNLQSIPAVTIDRPVDRTVAKYWTRNRIVHVCIRDLRVFFRRVMSPSRESCARHPRDENIVMLAAGASEQQKQHELKEESGFAGTGFKGGSGSEEREGWRSRRDRRSAEEKIEGEIPSESSRW